MGLTTGCLKREIEYDDDAQVEIVSAFYGYSRCLGLGPSFNLISTVLLCLRTNSTLKAMKDTQEEIIENGCLYDFVDGEFRHNVPSTFGIKMLCRQLFNPFWDAKALDGLPIEFSEPLVRAPEPEAIEFTLNNGDIVRPLCVTLAPANEPNEMTTCNPFY